MSAKCIYAQSNDAWDGPSEGCTGICNGALLNEAYVGRKFQSKNLRFRRRLDGGFRGNEENKEEFV